MVDLDAVAVDSWVEVVADCSLEVVVPSFKVVKPFCSVSWLSSLVELFYLFNYFRIQEEYK